MKVEINIEMDLKMIKEERSHIKMMLEMIIKEKKEMVARKALGNML
jgi:hypothetical protein